MRSTNSLINVYKTKKANSEIVTQILYGETFKKIIKTGLWVKIKNDSDNYKGFIKNKAFISNQKNTHKVNNLKAVLNMEDGIE